MADLSRQARRRGGIMAAAGIVILAVGQASLTESSRCQPSSPPVTEFAPTGSALWVSSGLHYAAKPARYARNSDNARTTCSVSALPEQRPRLVDPKFLRAPDVAAKTVASAAD
jgi:hypothetical protein